MLNDEEFKGDDGETRFFQKFLSLGIKKKIGQI